MRELNTYILEKLHLNKDLKDNNYNIDEKLASEITYMLDLEDNSKEYDVILKWIKENNITNVIGYIKDDYDFTIFTEDINIMNQSKINELRKYYKFDDKYFNKEILTNKTDLYFDNAKPISFYENIISNTKKFLIVKESVGIIPVYIIFHGNPYGTLG